MLEDGSDLLDRSKMSPGHEVMESPAMENPLLEQPVLEGAALPTLLQAYFGRWSCWAGLRRGVRLS